jgi:hypothetical protein
LSCTNRQTSNSVGTSKSLQIQRIVADTTHNPEAKDELEGYQIKNLLCAELGIYDIEHSPDSIELRLWYEPSMWEPHELYILKAKDTSWKAIRYLFWQRHASYETDEYKHWDWYRKPIIDTVQAESMYPRTMTWKQYAAELQIDSLWSFPSQSELKGDFGCLDGSAYTIEIKDKVRYKAFRYRCARGRDEQHHVKFIELVDKIKIPLRYNGMFSPL